MLVCLSIVFLYFTKMIDIKEFEKENGLLGCKELKLYKSGKISEQEFQETIFHYAKDYKSKIESKLKI